MGALQLSLLGTGKPRIDPDARRTRLQLDERSWVDVARGWLLGADSLLAHLVDTVDWKRGRRLMYERMVDDPRLSRWYPPDTPLPHPALAAMRTALDDDYGVAFGTVGLNYYRDGSDSVAPHADRELRNVDDGLVAIVTLGARRPFLVKPQQGGRSHDLAPASGDLLVMGGHCQADWEHAVPKVARCGPRISASWRWSSHAGAAARVTEPPR